MQLVVCHTWSEPIHEELHQRQADTTNSVPRPAFRHLQYALPYCKRRKAGRGTGNEANLHHQYIYSDLGVHWLLITAKFILSSKHKDHNGKPGERVVALQ